MDYSEKWGKDIDDATRLALNDLKCTIDEVEVIVLEEPSKGFLGIGAKLAKVRVEKKKPPTPEQLKEMARAEEEARRQKERAEADARREARKAEEAVRREKESAEPKAAAQEKPEQRSFDRKPERKAPKERFESKPRREERYPERQRREEKRPAEFDSMTEITGSPAELFLREITQKMGLDLNIHVYEVDDAIYVNIDGKDSGTIIGKRGQTLDAVQYLTSLVVNKEKEKHSKVVVNAENYREKREKTLEQLAKRLADKVYKTGKSVRLEPMNPYERKVIHATLQGNPHVTTRSEGEEPYRRVIIELK